MKRFIKLTCSSCDKVWVDIDSISAISEYVVKSDPNIKSLVWLKDGSGVWHVRETPKEVFEKIREVEE